ncbi:MAG: hypothetical protein KGQ52_11005 [Alphaproteobacteria bacterium]|nr:hypothetical protein [Alphaproteobacteria bacterium]
MKRGATFWAMALGGPAAIAAAAFAVGLSGGNGMLVVAAAAGLWTAVFVAWAKRQGQ